MLSLAIYKTISAALIFIVSIATILYLIRKNNKLHQAEVLQLAEALASGIFLGTALFHLLPESIHIFSRVYSSTTYPIAEVICAGSFLLMLFMERLSMMNGSMNSRYTIPYIIAVILMIHAITEGAALGIGMTLSEITLLFIAILAHKASETFALFIALKRGELPKLHILIISLIFAVMTPIGISLGNTFGGNALAAAWFNAFAAGTFLYISTLHHVHFHQHAEDAQGMLEFAALGVGLTAMGLIALWA
jgi:zinc transporter ZupT